MSDSVLTTLSDQDGFFDLHAWAWGNGVVVGHLEVEPPGPWPPYTVKDFIIHTRQARGDGYFAGRLVVDPYRLFIGEVIDRRTGRQVTGAVVTLKRVSGPFSAPDSATFVTAELGRFQFEPQLTGFGPLDFQATLVAPDDPEVYAFPLRIQPDYLDGAPYPTLLKFPRVLLYQVEVSRRGTGEFLPGVQVEFRRVAGVGVTPESTVTIPTGGRASPNMTPHGDGVLELDLTIRPPAPFRTEVVRLQLPTHYDDRVNFVGVFGYGPHVFLRAAFTKRSTGLPVPVTVQAGAKRVGGLPLVYPPGANPAADSGWRPIDKQGRMPWVAATADSGEVLFDLMVRFPGFPVELIRSVSAIARSDSVPNALGPFVVGPWLPWYGEVRDIDTDAPIPGAVAEFRRVSGGTVTPAISSSVVGPDGRFRVSAEPLDTAAVTGTLVVRFPGGAYRDSVVGNVTLRYTLDDTLRYLATYRFRRSAP